MKLKQGINIGGYLSQCEESAEHFKNFLTEQDIARIAGWGFDHVRLPVDADIIMSRSGIMRPETIACIDRVGEWCREYGLDMILDLHKAYGYDFTRAGSKENVLFSDPDARHLYLTLWEYLASRYQEQHHMAFELLNEIVEIEYADAWNELAAEAIRCIRSVGANNLIIYGGVCWNSADTLRLLERPNDTNCMFTFHFYEPLLFTHQKAYWVVGMNPDEEIPYPADMDYYRSQSSALGLQGQPCIQSKAKIMGPEFMEELILSAVTSAKEQTVPLYCGELGVIDRAPAEDTIRWFSDMNVLFQKYDIGYSIWNYKGKDFGLSDSHYSSFRDRLFAAIGMKQSAE